MNQFTINIYTTESTYKARETYVTSYGFSGYSNIYIYSDMHTTTSNTTFRSSSKSTISTGTSKVSTGYHTNTTSTSGEILYSHYALYRTDTTTYYGTYSDKNTSVNGRAYYSTKYSLE